MSVCLSAGPRLCGVLTAPRIQQVMCTYVTLHIVLTGRGILIVGGGVEETPMH